MKLLGRIIGWTCTILIAALSIFAGVMKFMPVEPGSQEALFAEQLGTAGLEFGLGILELAIVVLFLIPRTSTVGFVLMVGYFGGVVATMLTHGMTQMEVLPMYVILGLLTISGYFRNPELLSRLRGQKI